MYMAQSFSYLEKIHRQVDHVNGCTAASSALQVMLGATSTQCQSGSGAQKFPKELTYAKDSPSNPPSLAQTLLMIQPLPTSHGLSSTLPPKSAFSVVIMNILLGILSAHILLQSHITFSGLSVIPEPPEDRPPSGHSLP